MCRATGILVMRWAVARLGHYVLAERCARASLRAGIVLTEPDGILATGALCLPISTPVDSDVNG